jgi:hypothetical protein
VDKLTDHGFTRGEVFKMLESSIKFKADFDTSQ